MRLDKGDRVVGVALVPADEINGGGEPTIPPADEQENP
jgi:hypothetical protein